MKHVSNYINSDLLNKLIDKKLETFGIFVVKDEIQKKYFLYICDKVNSMEILLAEFKSYKQYNRWLTEAALMRVAADDISVKKIRQIYKKLFAFSRDPDRKDPFKED